MFERLDVVVTGMIVETSPAVSVIVSDLLDRIFRGEGKGIVVMSQMVVWRFETTSALSSLDPLLCPLNGRGEFCGDGVGFESS
jgi:hypothetical protein